MTGTMIAVAGLFGADPGDAFIVTASPARAFSISRTSPIITATVDGGTGPYTYSWTNQNPAIFANTPDASTTTFTTNASDAVLDAGVCTVQDDTGAIVSSNIVVIGLLQSGGG